jgi:hypothetical protein
MTQATMTNGTHIGLVSMCPACGQDRAQWYSSFALLSAAQAGRRLKGYCSKCDKYWQLSALEHDGLAASAKG